MAGQKLRKMRQYSQKSAFRREKWTAERWLRGEKTARSQPSKAALPRLRPGYKGLAAPCKRAEVKQRRILQTISQPVPESRLISSLPDRLQEWEEQQSETERQVLTEDQYSTVQGVKNIEEG